MKKLLTILCLLALTLVFTPPASAEPRDGDRDYRRYRQDRGRQSGYYRGGRGDGYYRGGRGDGYYSRREYQGRRRYYRGGRYYYRTQRGGYYPYGYRRGGGPGISISF